MEMPEGWERIRNFTTAEGYAMADVVDAALLMKEMAEVLEDLCKNPDQTKINWNRANQALEDFKNWK